MNTNITSGTIARTIILALALINQLLSATGHAVIPIEDATIEQLVSTSWTVLAAVWAWYKNNSFTAAAQEADVIMKDLKAGRDIESQKGVLVDAESQKGVSEND